LSKESTVLLWMLFKRVGRPAPHRKVCALEFDVTRSEARRNYHMKLSHDVVAIVMRPDSFPTV
jgi:hypothetical protein